jgi:ankyrin repeat protein
VKNDRDGEILKLLLANEKVDINETTSQQGLAALHLAIATSNETTTRVLLLSKGANPNLADKDGWTPLHWAARYTKDKYIVELLLNHPNVDVNLMNNEGRNALDFAKYNEHGLSEEIANLLREKGSVETEKEVSTIQNAMKQIQSRIFSNKKPEEVENFLSDDTIRSEDKIDRISEELLLSAIKDSNFEIVRNLLKSGADIRTCGENGANLLHLTSFHAKTTKLIDVILEKGKFDINGVDNDGRTPLHHALQGINPTINTAHLLQKGADPGIADKNGVTPLHMAARNAETMDLIEILLNTEAVDVNCVDKQGRTPLACARVNKHGLSQRITARLREYDDEKK